MALRISNLEQIAEKYSKKQYVFKDLHLDFGSASKFNRFEEKPLNGNDVQVDYDLAAIFNSLRNIFNTKPGQRFLFPKYGLDLTQYLFEPITTENGRSIGERIGRSIDQFETRVVLLECIVTPNEEDNTYEIIINIQVPIYNTVASMSALLDKKAQKMIVLETSRNR